MTVVSRWIFDVAFAAPPQSGLAWFCFLLPSGPGEFRPESHRSVLDRLRSHGSCHPWKAGAFRRDHRVPPVAS